MAGNEDSHQSGGRSLSGGPVEPLPDSWTRPSTQSGLGRIGAWGSSNSSQSGRIAGIQDFASQSSPSMRDDDDDEEEAHDDQPQNFFAGGERSAISVEGPGRRGNDLVRDILRKAAQAGPPTSIVSGSDNRPAFTGSGHTLGSDEVPSEFIPDPDADTGTPEETAIRNITFWRDGFSVEDGPLLRYDVPENARLLNEINTGHAPPSILNVGVGQPVELRVARRTNEDYIPPPTRPLGAFGGHGQRLGNVIPTISGSDSPSSHNIPGAFPVSASEARVASQQSPPRFEVDFNEPTTSVQIRLADGTRLVARMNLTHTVGDIRNFINASYPGASHQSYTIGTTFPNRTLDDDSITIEKAGLKNCVIVQRLM